MSGKPNAFPILSIILFACIDFSTEFFKSWPKIVWLFPIDNETSLIPELIK